MQNGNGGRLRKETTVMSLDSQPQKHVLRETNQAMTGERDSHSTFLDGMYF